MGRWPALPHALCTGAVWSGGAYALSVSQGHVSLDPRVAESGSVSLPAQIFLPAIIPLMPFLFSSSNKERCWLPYSSLSPSPHFLYMKDIL